MKKRKWLLGITLTICMVLAGCGKNEDTADSSLKPSKVLSPMSEETTETAKEPEHWNPGIVHRQVLFDEGYEAGVLFLGYVDAEAGDLESDRDYYESVFKKQGYAGDFPFLEEIPNSNFVETEYGQELYCIIPQDDMATVSVNQWIVNEENDYEGEAGEVLYHSEYGSPILLKCNVSEVVPDVEVVIDDNKGNTLRWRPFISGMDGHVDVEAEEGDLYDFSSYAEEEDIEILNVLTGKNYEYYWSDEYEVTLASMTAPVVRLDEESAARYPELSEAMANNINARRTKLFSNYEDLIPLAKELYPGLAEYFSEFEAREEALVRRADSKVVSILYKGHAYEGGAHGFTYYYGENYDTKTGELLKLEDVVLNPDELPTAVKEQLDLHWDPLYFYEDLDLNQHFKENMDSIAWLMDYHGITFYFNPYEIAPYASGIQVVTVAFEDYPELFAESYIKGSESYGIQIDMDTPFYYDVDSDGELDELLVFGVLQDDQVYVEHNIYIDGKCFEQSYYENEELLPEGIRNIYAFEILTPHIVHLADGRNYLFIESQTESDYRINTVYELTDGTVKLVEDINSSQHTEWNEAEDCVLKQALTNPYNFMLDTRTWVIGTSDGYQNFYISDDGYSYSYEPYYTFDSHSSFTALKDFEGQLVDEYGVVGDTMVVKAGEELTYYRTDACLFADFILEDGRVVRAELEWDCGSCMIEGTYVSDLFDGIVFAG